MDIYCTYLTIYKGNLLPKFYIGSTSIDRIKSGYHGSVCSKRYSRIWKSEIKHNPYLFETKIISTHTSRQEAFDKELKLQLALKVQQNPLYINLGYAQPNGCYGLGLSGGEHWSKQPGKVHNAKINHPKGMSGKKHKKSRNQYMSEIQLGEKNHFFGKHHNDETKRKISEKAKKKIWITNGIENKRSEIDYPMPNGWKRGRVISADKSPKTMMWINNGNYEKYIKQSNDIPPDWVRGRLKGIRP